MALHRRSFLKLAGIAGTGSALGLSAPAIVRAATPIKLTLPWLPLGTYSFTFVAKKLGYWEKRGLDVSIDRGFGSTKVCVPVDQGQYDFGLLDMAVHDGCVGRGWTWWRLAHLAAFADRHFLAEGTQHHAPKAARRPDDRLRTRRRRVRAVARLREGDRDRRQQDQDRQHGPGEPDARGGGQADQGGRQFLRQYRAHLLGEPHSDQRHAVSELRRRDVQRRRRLQARDDREAARTLPELRRRPAGRSQIRLPQSGKGDRPSHR